MKTQDMHFHAWILRINENTFGFHAMEGAYPNDITCRRHALKEVDGDPNKVIIMICRSEDTCPSKHEAAAMAT